MCLFVLHIASVTNQRVFFIEIIVRLGSGIGYGTRALFHVSRRFRFQVTDTQEYDQLIEYLFCAIL